MWFFKMIGLLDLLERMLAPVLPLFGMGKQAAPLAVVGMVMGLSCGGHFDNHGGRNRKDGRPRGVQFHGTITSFDERKNRWLYWGFVMTLVRSDH